MFVVATGQDRPREEGFFVKICVLILIDRTGLTLI